MRVYRIKNKSYGKRFIEKDYVYFEGRSKPSLLQEKGNGFSGGKHLLELLHKQFNGQFRLVISPDKTEFVKKGRGKIIRISVADLRRLNQRKIERVRSVGLNLTGHFLKDALGIDVGDIASGLGYEKGMFARILRSGFDTRRLTVADREALTRFIQASSVAGTIDVRTAYRNKQSAQLLYVRALLDQFRGELSRGHLEAWWQGYFDENILYFQDNYISRLPKLNVSLGNTKFPDFCLVTTDGYLDVLEIKTPATLLLREDSSRGNFYASSDLAKAVIQVEKYVDLVMQHQDAIRNHLRDHEGIDLQIIRPRGLIIAGQSSEFTTPAKQGDFRRINMGLKNVQITPFDELANRLRNTVEAISQMAAKSKQGKGN